MTALPQHVRDRIIELGQAGWYGKDIAAVTGASPSGVSRILRAARPAPPELPVGWQEQAPCRGDNRFTRTDGEWRQGELRELLLTCATCPVKAECRQELDATKDRIGVRAGVVWGWAEYPERAKPSRVVSCRCGEVFIARTRKQRNCSELCARRFKKHG